MTISTKNQFKLYVSMNFHMRYQKFLFKKKKRKLNAQIRRYVKNNNNDKQ